MSNAEPAILVIGPAWVGDMVMAQSLFKLVRQLQPTIAIDVLAPDWTRGLLQRMPEVRHMHAIPIKHGEFQWQTRKRIGQRLAAYAYQQAIVLPNSWKSALIPWYAKIPRRTGWRGEMRYGLLNDMRKLNKQQLPLMIQRFAALGLEPKALLPSHLPHPRLHVDITQRDETLARFNLSLEQPILALCPGAEFGPAKRWPVQHYAEVAGNYINKGWQVWLFGSQNDQAVAHDIQACVPAPLTNLAGKTTLAEAIDLLSCATSVVTNDSGLMHIAAALNRSLVAVYGSSDPRFTPPLTQHVKILRLGLACSPCFKRECPLGHLDCLQKLLPQQVLTALDQFEIS
ncbi:MAG: lipopolysaccharide heptosyltransferase II [Gammaproteobacteria bacterium]